MPDQYICDNCGDEVEGVNNVNGTDYCDSCHDDLSNCINCRTVVESNDVYTDSCGDEWCESCYGETFLRCDCCGCELNVHNDGHVSTGNGYTYCDDCYNENFFNCEVCGECYNREEERIPPGHESWCTVCFDEEFVVCSSCCEVYPYNETRRRSSGIYCTGCDCGASWDHAGFYDENPTYDEVGSQRKYGIELETHVCTNSADLDGNTIFGCKEDGSVDGMEFVSPVLYGDKGFEAVDHLCGFASDNNWEVASSCGYHLHCDMSEEDDETLRKVAIAYHYTYELWSCFVSNSRKRNYYCAPNAWDHSDVMAYDTFSAFLSDYCGERYRWLNLAAYIDHRTFELRSHGGTMNATKIKNWAKAHLRFIDAVKAMTLREVTDAFAGCDPATQFATVAEMWDDADLADYYRQRAAHFNKPLRTVSLVEASV